MTKPNNSLLMRSMQANIEAERRGLMPAAVARDIEARHARMGQQAEEDLSDEPDEDLEENEDEDEAEALEKRRAPPKPPMSLPDIMRKQIGASEADLRVDIVANMQRRHGEMSASEPKPDPNLRVDIVANALRKHRSGQGG